MSLSRSRGGHSSRRNMGGLDEMFVANNPMFLRRLVRTPIPRSPPQIPHEKSTQTRIPTHPNTTHANLMFLRRVGPAALRRAGPPSNTETFLGGPALEANWSHPTDDFQQVVRRQPDDFGSFAAILVNRSSAVSRSSAISAARMSGAGRESVSVRLWSLIQKRSRLSLSRLSSSS